LFVVTPRVRRCAVLKLHIIENKASVLIDRNTSLKELYDPYRARTQGEPSTIHAASLLFDPERLQLSMKRGTFHANELCGPGYVAAKAADLSHQIVPLEGFPRLA
jgi:hypothetical protein